MKSVTDKARTTYTCTCTSLSVEQWLHGNYPCKMVLNMYCMKVKHLFVCHQCALLEQRMYLAMSCIELYIWCIRLWWWFYNPMAHLHNMMLICYPYVTVSCSSETSHILSPLLFWAFPIFFNSQNTLFTCLISAPTACIARNISYIKWSFVLAKHTLGHGMCAHMATMRMCLKMRFIMVAEN